MNFVLVIAGAVCLVWAAVLFLRTGVLAGCFSVLLAGSCFGHAFFHTKGPVPLTADRVLLALVLLQFVAYRRLGLADPKPIGKTDWCLLAFIGLLAASTFLHDWRADQSRPLAELLLYFVMPATLYWVARQAAHRRDAVLGLVAGLAVFGCYLAVTAIAETTDQAWAVFPRYIASAEHEEFLGRGRGPLLNPAGTGFLIGVGWMAALLWWPRANRAGKLGLVFLSLLFAAGAYFTLTRAVWAGAGAGLLIWLACTLPKTWRPVVIGGVCLAALGVVVAKWDSLTALKRDKHLAASEAAESAELRPVLAMVAWQMFKDRPLFGCGFGQYENQFQPYLADRSTRLILSRARNYVQHNTFLSLLTETGLAGMGLFIAMLIGWAANAWRLWRNNAAPTWSRRAGLLFVLVLAAYLPGAMFHDLSLIPMTTMYLFFLAGLSTGLAHRPCGAENLQAASAAALRSSGAVYAS